MCVKFIFFSPQVPTVQFAGYVTSVVEDLYKTVEAAIQGTITSAGTLGTVLLCETLLSYLPTSCTWNQPYSVLNAYGVTPHCCVLPSCACVDLDPQDTTRITTPSVEALLTLPAHRAGSQTVTELLSIPFTLESFLLFTFVSFFKLYCHILTGLYKSCR